MRKSTSIPIIKDILSIALLASLSFSLAGLSQLLTGRPLPLQAGQDPTTSHQHRPVMSAIPPADSSGEPHAPPKTLPSFFKTRSVS